MLRKILFIIVGIITATIIIYLIESLGHLVYPPSEDLNLKDPDTIKSIMKDVPAGALLFVLLAYALGSFCGGLITAFISKSSKVINAIIVGFVLLIFGLTNLLIIPHPVWFTIVSIILYIPCAYMGGKVALKLSK